MTERRLPLSSLSRGDRFLGGDGQYWTVLKNEAGFMTAIRTGRSTFTAQTSDELVTVVNRDDDTEKLEAIAAVSEAMPTSTMVSEERILQLADAIDVSPEVLLNTDDRDHWSTNKPPQFRAPIQVAAQYASIHEIRSHIHLLHGEYAGDIRTSKALSAAHAEMHAEGHMKVPHTHGQTGE